MKLSGEGDELLKIGIGYFVLLSRTWILLSVLK